MAACPLPIEKAPPTTIAEVADRNTNALARAIFAWLSTLQTVQPAELYRTNWRQFLESKFTGAGLEPHQNSPHDLIVRTMEGGTRVGLAGLHKVPARKFESVGAVMSFTMTNPQVAAFLAQYSFELIGGISAEVTSTIRAILTNASMNGLAPIQQARQIQQLIGLNARQAQAVLSFRQALEQGKLKSVLDRALRDGRYDSTLLSAANRGGGLSPEQIDKMVARYAERSLRHRAMTIARTETIRAANSGQIEVWRQAQAQNLLNATAREHWVVSHDERACPVCLEIPRMNPDGVPIGGQFATPNGPVSQPPAHTTCRCALSL